MTISSPTDELVLKPCPFCKTEMHRHQHCFSHPKPTNGDCVIRHYSFDNSKVDAWNTRAAIAAMPDLTDRVRRLEEALRAFVVLERSIKIDIGLTHKGRLNTASDLAIKCDADFRRELEEVFNIARTALGEPQC